MDLKIYSVKNVVNRLLEYVLQKLYISILLATSFFVIICEMKTKANFSRNKNTFRSFGLQFELLMSLCLQIKSASDSEAQKPKQLEE